MFILPSKTVKIEVESDNIISSGCFQDLKKNKQIKKWM